MHHGPDRPPECRRIGVILRGALLCSLLALSGCDAVKEVAESLRSPPAPFDKTAAPPAPDYAKANAWLAFPGRDGAERSTPPGIAAVDEASAPADVFFVHPTSSLTNDVWNAPYDARAPYNPPILLNQISAFNSCCRLYAPQYRQASLHALNASLSADDLAYSDIERGFRYYIAYLNHGRPFIIASHSQGSMHAVRLLQAQILGTPLQGRLVAAYVVGAYAPADFGNAGLPTCERADQTGCIVSWNTSQTAREGASKLIRNVTYWWKGAWRQSGQQAAICTNPLTWSSSGAAPASANPGSEPFPEAPFARKAATLPPLVPHLTGAACHAGLLDVDIPGSAPLGFHSALSLLYGSYHQVDYGVFYAAIRANAAMRVDAWRAAHGRPGAQFDSLEAQTQPSHTARMTR